MSRLPLEARVRAELSEWESRGLLRTLRAPAGIDLSSNDYLGLAGDPRLSARLAEAATRGGVGSGGSRLLRGHRAAFDEAERAFAAFKAADRALYFSSGYLANLAVLSTLTRRGDVVVADRLNHASLRDGVRLSPASHAVFAHAGVDALARLLSSRPEQGHRFVVTESVFSMDGDKAPLREYARLCREMGATLIVDEAHAVGIYGARGSGLLEEQGIAANDVLSINTAGKALGVAGAFVAGPSWAIDYLVQRARPFVFSTAPPPALAAALVAAIAIVQSEPQRRARLLALASYFRARLASAGIDAAAGDSPIVPIVLGDSRLAVAVADSLQAEGFDVRAIRPPTVAPGTARLRISVNTGLDEPIIDRAVTALSRALRQTSPGEVSCHAVSS